jgi:transcriptional regulator with XRE-family HTH domain
MTVHADTTAATPLLARGPNDYSLAAMVRECREARGLTLSSLALRVGCARSTLQDIENGHTAINLILAYALSKELRLPLVAMAWAATNDAKG